MNIAALMTSAGINIGLCILFFSLYSILRKQPVNFSVYFPRKLAEDQAKCHDSFSLERLVPSASWIKKAWELSEQEILAAAGLDAVVFIRIFVLSMRIFVLCAVLCIFILLPMNYYGKQLHHMDITHIPYESLDAFTISNVQPGSKRFITEIWYCSENSLVESMKELDMASSEDSGCLSDCKEQSTNLFIKLISESARRPRDVLDVAESNDVSDSQAPTYVDEVEGLADVDK